MHTHGSFVNWFSINKYSIKKYSNIEDYYIGKLVNKENLRKNKAVKEKQKQKGRRKYLKVSVLHSRKRNAKRKKEILEGECVAVEKEKCESERRRGKSDDGGWVISYRNNREINHDYLTHPQTLTKIVKNRMKMRRELYQEQKMQHTQHNTHHNVSGTLLQRWRETKNLSLSLPHVNNSATRQQITQRAKWPKNQQMCHVSNC